MTAQTPAHAPIVKDLIDRVIDEHLRDIAAEMIRSGAATEYCRFSRGYYGTC